MTKHLLSSILLLAVGFGCATQNYVYGTGEHGGTELAPDLHQQVIVGEPSEFLDNSDWIWPGSWLAKLVLWNKNIDSHTVSDATLVELTDYIEKNDLGDVQVLVNTYKPGTQWSRLFKNREVAAGWRFTLGIISTSIYTIIPGRFFGGDHYNPYTNTISIYSDDPAIALHEAGHAKDFNGRKYKGLNAALYSLPGAPLYYEAVATSDALTYLDHECRYVEEKRAYRVLHPAYGTYVGGLFLRQAGYGLLGAIPGHLTGAISAATVKQDEVDASHCSQFNDELPGP